ncbi:hypothetical protein NZ698_07360 [Chryseobacterium sp. PBS4-4]|uniref:Type II toxin-antitoxin system RelE/ParE family toxin n=1 Tax=Chryseobacterium edaphi TaxID=2976532 RepID=A0ABT2W460_9FLAO|nr:hypothetical protein [Chryseobacterium edaphi]MCU7617011.1 hypothetical protein [Chryseobacterium edaphi]
MKIVFSITAIESLKQIIDFLNERWTHKELKLFNKDLEKLIESFNDQLISYQTIDSDKKLQFALLGKKQVKVYFKMKEDFIEILLFLPSKSNPENIQKLLNK